MDTIRLLRSAALMLTAFAWCAGSAHAEVESRSVAGFDAVLVEVPGELQIDKGPREALTLEAEPAVLRMITTELQGRQLRIGLAQGRVETQQPIRIRLTVRDLRAVESRASSAIKVGAMHGDTVSLRLSGGGSIHVAQLAAQTLEVRIAGAGEVVVDAGRVVSQRIAIGGIGGYSAPALESQSADVTIDGNGKVRLAAASRLAVGIGGVGQVRYRGDPVLTQTIRGIGTIERD